MTPLTESSALPALVLLALLGVGTYTEIFSQKAWRSRWQHAASTVTYLSLLPFSIGMAIAGLGPVAALVSCACLYQGLKWLLVSTETRQATIMGVSDTFLVIKTDDGALLTSSLLVERRSFSRGENVRVRITSSYLFGWRLRAEVA